MITAQPPEAGSAAAISPRARVAAAAVRNEFFEGGHGSIFQKESDTADLLHCAKLPFFRSISTSYLASPLRPTHHLSSLTASREWSVCSYTQATKVMRLEEDGGGRV